VWGKSDGDTGVYGSSATGVGGVFAGGQAPLLLIPSGTVGPPTTGIHQQGEVVVDANGVFWVCIAATTRAGTWKSLFSVVPIPNVRVLNTRPAHQIGPYAGPIANNTVLTLAVAGQTFTRSDGSQVTIPSTATGVIGNLTAADATGSCFLALVPHGASYTGVSSINFPVQVQGTGLANAFTGALSSDGMVDIYVGNCSSYTVNVIVDITGYIS
jgi:hypothetical protein